MRASRVPASALASLRARRRSVVATSCARRPGCVSSSPWRARAGTKRDTNEDSHSALDGSTPLFVVADGVGGGAMAAQASRELVSHLHAALDHRRLDAAVDSQRSPPRGSRRRPQHRAAEPRTSGAATVALCAGTGSSALSLAGSHGSATAASIASANAPRQARPAAHRRRHVSTPARSASARRLARRSRADGRQRGGVDAERPWRRAWRERDAGHLQRRRPQARRPGGHWPTCFTAAHRSLAAAAVSLRSPARAAAATMRRCSSCGANARRALHVASLVAGRRSPDGHRRNSPADAMTPEQIDRVFGNGRLKMVTGEHVEVFREAVATGERRRYTKRFLNTSEADFGQWTEREWRILARLIGHGIACVPEVVQFDRGRHGGTQIVQTYDAGVTVDQWATLLPVERDGRVYRHVFEDCAHWWALAHHCLLALDAIHPLELVHLDIKGDNVCIPYAPADFDPDSSNLRAAARCSRNLALIDFAFALISRESLTTPLPIGWQKDYDYQSPRLLAALEAGRNGDLQRTRELDWRCDMYSLAAMLQAVFAGHWRVDANRRLDPRASRRRDGAARKPARLPRQRASGAAAAREPHRGDGREAARARDGALARARMDARARRARRAGSDVAADSRDVHRTGDACCHARQGFALRTRHRDNGGAARSTQTTRSGTAAPPCASAGRHIGSGRRLRRGRGTLVCPRPARRPDCRHSRADRNSARLCRRRRAVPSSARRKAPAEPRRCRHVGALASPRSAALPLPHPCPRPPRNRAALARPRKSLAVPPRRRRHLPRPLRHPYCRRSP